MRVLLVDDEEELVATLAERLFYREINADWVTSGLEALEMAEKYKYDIAVLDVKMPGISGCELKKSLQDKHPAMKYIFLTGHGSEDDFKSCTEEAGAEYYLVKPVNIDSLIKKMNEVIGS